MAATVQATNATFTDALTVAQRQARTTGTDVRIDVDLGRDLTWSYVVHPDGEYERTT